MGAVNIVLLSPAEAASALLPFRDERTAHVRRVLRKGPGDSFLIGVEGGCLREAVIVSDGPEGMALRLGPERPAPPLHPLTLVLGFPRPIQANRVLKDLCSLGVRRILICGTELGEKSYREGSFFREAGWKRAIREGAAQAGSPLLSEVTVHDSLQAALDALGPVREARFALDAEGDHPPLSRLPFDPAGGAALAVGSERGWTDSERKMLHDALFAGASLGERILRTETACVVSCAIILSRMGVM